jgi:hypothetical protein
MVVRALTNREREELRAQLGEAFAPFASGRGYEIPGVALTAVAS